MSQRLSAAMRQALRAIVTDPEAPWTRHAQPRTVLALERRGLVETFTDDTYGSRVRATDAGRAWHEHRFEFTAHADGCHWFVTTAVCGCGATLRQTSERDAQEDGYSRLWMMDEDGAPTCERCEELLDGAEPEHRSEVFMPDGSPVPA